MKRGVDLTAALTWGWLPVFWITVALWLWPSPPALKFSAITPQRAITAVCFRIEGDAELKCIEVTEGTPAKKTTHQEKLL